MNYTPEEIAELLKERPNQPHYIAGLIRKAVAAEREACARVCDAIERNKWEVLTGGGSMAGIGPMDCAKAIRARGEE